MSDPTVYALQALPNDRDPGPPYPVLPGRLAWVGSGDHQGGDRRLLDQGRRDGAEQDPSDRAVAAGAADEQVDTALADHGELVDHLTEQQLAGSPHAAGEAGDHLVEGLAVGLAHLLRHD